VIHATASGTGVHLYTSPLAPTSAPDDSGTDSTAPFTPVPWESAQATFVEQSRKLSEVLKATLAKASVPVLTGTAPLRPLDNLMCPAVAVEIAPNSASVSATDSTYQQQLVVALASALQLWRDQSTPSGPGVAP
jgi:N-acetylmuramoyl-L-alanine amidase